MRLAVRGATERTPENLLLLMSFSGAVSFALWTALINNFAVERAAFTGAEIGALQSIREIPGLLAFTAIYVLLVIKEQRFAYLSLILLGIGTALTGFLPSFWGLVLTTTLMSIGFHYHETLLQSLSLQWLKKERAPIVLGQVVAARNAATICILALLWVGFSLFDWGFAVAYVVGGGLTVALALFAWQRFPRFPEIVVQNKHLVLRQRYWLYYALTFMSGARRQIFVVFAGFLLVEKFGYGVAEMTLLLLFNSIINLWAAPYVGRMIHRFGERTMLTVEHTGLVLVFLGYAFVTNPWVAAGLYVVDHVFFAMAIALKTYFQKIGDPADMAPTAAVAFTINHIAAVFIPVLFGLIWLWSPMAVFLIGAFIAAISLTLARLVPRAPAEGNETTWSRPQAVAAE
ncbi:MAG: MFS transporter [Geminicoccaceae bacterium]|nr:MAG: MFS transporter [Geminicoccaceae bacterium]